MMYIDIHGYEEIIYELKVFVDNIETRCGVLMDISSGYAHVADEDSKVLKANEQLRSRIKSTLDSIDPIREIILALQQEIEVIPPPAVDPFDFID